MGARPGVVNLLLCGCALGLLLGDCGWLHSQEITRKDSVAQAQPKESVSMPDRHRPAGTPPGENAQQGDPGTFVSRMELTPYPYDGKHGDSDVDFFDTVNQATGERFHTNRYGLRLAEKSHYRDNRVLFHVPKHFDPRRPILLVVFFHGNQSDIIKSNREYSLAKQVENSGKNAILIIPQLARDAPDSSPGKLFQRNLFRAFMTEAADVLAAKVGEAHRQALAEAPVFIAAFSGGYKSAAYVLERGGVNERVVGLLLLDALYEDVDKFRDWWRTHGHHSIFVNVFGRGECEENSRLLANQLNRPDLLDHPVWPDTIDRGKAYFIQSHHPHLDIPRLGPPSQPLRSMLLSIDVGPQTVGEPIRRNSENSPQPPAESR
jgi:hypothetical protein